MGLLYLFITRRSLAGFTISPLNFIGKISYGVYIYHGLVINILVQLHYTGQWKYVAILIPIAFAIALFSWKFIEEPMLRRKKKTINIQLKENNEADKQDTATEPQKIVAIATGNRLT